MTTQEYMVQIGASRDLIDAYLPAARRHGLSTVLVETPAHLALRTARGGPAFDREIPIDSPADPRRVVASLEAASITPCALVAGFERYVGSTFAVARLLGLPLRFSGGSTTMPPLDKAAQRRALALRAPSVRQPRHVVLDLTAAKGPNSTVGVFFPSVVKVTTGGGGLGVYRANCPDELIAALRRLKVLRNYDGSLFSEALVEEWVSGVEFSVQGLARDGSPALLACCEKVITSDPDAAEPSLAGFRERAFLAVPGSETPDDVRRLVEDTLESFGYSDGPFHIDLIRSDGVPHFIEMGFRLSGAGLVRLVNRLTGRDWAGESFDWLLSGRISPAVPAVPARCLGQCLAASAADLERARRLAVAGHPVEVQTFAPIPTPSVEFAADAGIAADLARHAGFIGRVVASGTSSEEVRRLLAGCCPDIDPEGGVQCVG